MTTTIAGVDVPDSKLAREATEMVRDTERELLFHHSRPVFLFGALTGKRKSLVYDPELLYVSALFHDMGLTKPYRTMARFEVDSANTARDFMRRHGLPEASIELVWTAIALHTTPGIPEHMKPEIALVTAGVEMDVLGFGFSNVTDADRAAVVEAHPPSPRFKQDIIDAFYEGNAYRPESTFGDVNADVLALKDESFHRIDCCQTILHSAWPSCVVG